MIHAAGSGVTLTLIGTRPEERDTALSEATREAILAAVTTNAVPDAATGQDRVPGRAVALKAVLPEASAGFTPSESAPLSEWHDRLARHRG
jgi:hypothetical protein